MNTTSEEFVTNYTTTYKMDSVFIKRVELKVNDQNDTSLIKTINFEERFMESKFSLAHFLVGEFIGSALGIHRNQCDFLKRAK